MQTIIGIYLFLLGASFGSFALVVVDRMHAEKSWVKGRSKCDSCKKTLQAMDLIPIFSWLINLGKCRYCGVKLSAMYPIVEIGLGLAFVLSYYFWPYELVDAFSYSILIVWLIALIPLTALLVFDIRWFLLPTKLIRSLVVLGLVWVGLDVYAEGLSVSIFISYITALGVGFGFFYLLHMISKGKWIGDGDVRFGVVIGLFTGSPLTAWMCLFTASILGLFVSIPVVLKNPKNRMKLMIPFGPFLIMSLFITVLFGANIIDWYKEYILLL